jgi:hypothetical protein
MLERALTVHEVISLASERHSTSQVSASHSSAITLLSALRCVNGERYLCDMESSQDSGAKCRPHIGSKVARLC